MEVWKDIKGYEGKYQVSNYGNVKSLERTCISRGNMVRKVPQKYLKFFTNPDGYLLVKLYNNTGKKQTLKIHRLVALAFIEPNGKPYVNHKNGIKADNTVNNLEWVTPSENVNHAYKNGLAPVGINAKFNKWSEDVVRYIKQNKHIPLKDICLKFNMPISTAYGIRTNRTWKYLTY